MKATLHFNLPEEQEDHYFALHGIQYSIVLDELDNWLRGMAKYEDKHTVSIDEVRTKLHQLKIERDLV